MLSINRFAFVALFALSGAALCSCSSDKESETVGANGVETAGTSNSNAIATGGVQPSGAGGASAGGTQKTNTGGKSAIGSGGKSGKSGKGGKGGAAGKATGGKGGVAGTPVPVEASCGTNDNPETGIQGGVYPGTVNCGLTLLSDIPHGGHVQGAGHCGYVRLVGGAAYNAGNILAFSLADPLHPVQTDEEPGIGGSESMRARTVKGRSILVSGSGVYDVSNCEDIVKKGEIAWPSANAQSGFFMAALSSHEIAISHDAKRVYGGMGLAIVHIDDLNRPETWTISDWKCELNRQSEYTSGYDPADCEGPTHPDTGRQYSHASDDNLEGTVWWGGNQNGDGWSQLEPSTTRMVDISDRNGIQILDTINEFPGHSTSWWRTPDKRDFIMGVNEGLGDRCTAYPRPTNLGWARDVNAVEVTGNKFGKPFTFTLDINKPENCQEPDSNANISAHTTYSKGNAAFAMIEFGGAGLRVFDLRDGYHPKEVAYYNDHLGQAHSATFYYDEARGIMLASGSTAMHVLMLQPQIIAALGLPYPTDPDYPYVK